MKSRWLDGLLIIFIAIGSLQFVQVQSQLVGLHREQTRIAAAVGTLEVSDPKQVHIRAIDQEHPWQWAWRVYFPENATGTLRYSIGTTGSSGSHGFGSSTEQFIARVSLSELKDGRVGLYMRFHGSSGFSSFGSADFGEFLREHRAQLKIEQFGAPETVQIKAGDPPVRFFRVSLPDDLAREATQKFPNEQALIPTLVEVQLECK